MTQNLKCEVPAMKKHGITLGPAILVIVALSATPSPASTIHIPADQPTIQAGIDAASAGDVVLVAPGFYRERIDFVGKAITVRGARGPGRSIVDGGQAGSVVTFTGGEGPDSTLTGFTIRNGDAEDGGGIHCNGASPTLRSCTIRGNRARDWGGGILCFSNASPLITNCRIDGNVANMGGGIGCRNAPSPTITHCVISNNHSTNDGGGIQLWYTRSVIRNTLVFGNSADYDGGGVHGWDGGSASMVNCTLTGNHAVRKGGGLFGGSGGSFAHSTFAAVNCILWGNDAAEGAEVALDYHGSTLDVRYSDVRGGESAVFTHSTGTLTWGEGNIDLDPLFVGGGDYHLVTGSPCIDAGTRVGTRTDLDGEARPHGQGVDIGSDEYTGPRWALELEAVQEAGSLNLDFTLATPEPARWWVLLFTTAPTLRVLMVFRLDLAVTDPPRQESFTRPFPDIGPVGALTFLRTEAGVQAHDLEWVDTGGPGHSPTKATPGRVTPRFSVSSPRRPSARLPASRSTATRPWRCCSSGT